MTLIEQHSDLRAFREYYGLAAKQVAEILGYSPEHISRCEHGTRNLSANAWRALECWVNHATQFSRKDRDDV